MQKRRQFLKNSILASGFLGLSCASTPSKTGKAAAKNREYYELRVYRFKEGGDRTLLDSYLQEAAIPAWNRQGISPVGAFVEKEPKDGFAVWVLIPYPTVEHFGIAGAKLATDPVYQAAGSRYLQTTKDKPGFDRIDSQFFVAFSGIPKIELPPYCREKRSRMFEIRTYESYGEVKAQKKVDMFNDGEIQVMRETGLGPIFYGQALVGQSLPHLTYMLSAENDAAHKEHWGKFGKDPRWDKMKNDPQYADTVSRIRNWFLVPTPYSQI
jgi:hypothetical protein